MARFLKIIVFCFVLAQPFAVSGQSSSQNKTTWQNYPLERTGLSIEFPSKPNRADFGDLPVWFKSQIDGRKTGYSVRSGNLEAHIYSWEFPNPSAEFENLEATLSMRGLQVTERNRTEKLRLSFQRTQTKRI